MPVETQSVKSIFLSALERGSPAERAAYLDAACAGDQALRMRVEALLAAHAESGEFPDFVAMAAESKTPLHEAETLAPDGGPPTPLLNFLAPPREAGHLGRLDHYEIHRLVGQGGMGVVFKAFDETLDRIVAVKVLAPHFAANATARRRFIREAKAIAAVVHEHVVTVHAVEESGTIPYLVMQFIQGVSLQDRLERGGPLDVKPILRIGMQAARGLAAAHAQGIVHRDIKPANILLENGVERVKITDFGLARAVDDVSITQSGVIAGTPMFMSPEQANSQPADPRSDLFSLGSVLYTLCTGHPPFRADSTPAVLMRVVEDMPRPVREINPDVPDWLEAIIAKLHAKKPEDRFQSAKEVAELLEQHLAHLQQPHLAPRPAPVSVPAHSQSRLAALPSRSGASLKTLLSWGLLIFFVLLAVVPAINLVERSHTYPAILRAAALVVAIGGLISAAFQAVRIRRQRRATAPPAAGTSIEATGGIVDVLPATPPRSAWPRLIWTGLGYALLVFVLFGFIDSYSDAGWWTTPWIEFSSAAAFLGLAVWHFRRGPRWLAAVPVLLAALFVAIGFVLWPYATGRTFARLVHDGRFEEANRMLVNIDPWTYANGKLTVRDKTGASVDLDARDFPLLSYDGSWDHFIGQKDETASEFTLTSHRVNSCFCNITVTAHYGTVVCESIHRYVADRNNVAQVLSPFHWAQRRGEAGPPATAPADRRGHDGWVKLFNGKDLTGWQTVGGTPATWTVENGTLRGAGSESYLVSERNYADFHLKAEARINPGGGWGMLFRTDPSLLSRKNVTPPGLRANVSYLGPTNDVLGQIQMQLELVRDGIPQATNGLNIKPHDWFPIEVIVQDDGVEIKIKDGGQGAGKFKPPLPPSGAIILRLPNANTTLEFRKIEIKDLSARAEVAPPFDQGKVILEGRGVSKREPDMMDVLVDVDPKKGTVTFVSGVKEEYLGGSSEERQSKLNVKVEAEKKQPKTARITAKTEMYLSFRHEPSVANSVKRQLAEFENCRWLYARIDVAGQGDDLVVQKMTVWR